MDEFTIHGFYYEFKNKWIEYEIRECFLWINIKISGNAFILCDIAHALIKSVVNLCGVALYLRRCGVPPKCASLGRFCAPGPAKRGRAFYLAIRFNDFLRDR
jgi:hypothetical protein